MKMFKTGLISLALVYIIGLNGYSQGYYEWGDPFPLTDSTHDNCNPSLLRTYHNYEEKVFLVWDKSEDTISTEIWMDNILDAEPPQAILAEPGIQYSHPMFVDRGYSSDDILFYILYQSNQNGNQDLYYLTYFNNDSLSSPEALAVSPGDDIQLTVSREMFFDVSASEVNLVAWINNGNLYASTLIVDSAQYFTQGVLVDSSSCSEPSVCMSGGFFGSWEGSILYEKGDTTTTHIYQSFNEGNNSWGTPDVYYDSTSAKNPTRMNYYGMKCFSTYLDTSWRILLDDEYGPNHIYDISSQTPFDPAVHGAVYGVDGWYDLWIAITYPVDELDEIFVWDNYSWPAEFKNFSKSGTMNRDPGFFNGENYNGWCWYDYLVWESFRNGHWQVWAAKVIQCMGSVNDIEIDEQFISVHPNPFTHETTLEFTLNAKSDLMIEVYDNRGMKVDEIAKRNMTRGEHQLRWKGEGLPAGVYILKMAVGGKTYSAKLVKSL